MPTLLHKIEHDRLLDQAKESTVVEKMCRMTLSKTWPTAEKPRPVELDWCKGRGFKKTILILRPGSSLEQPLDKCHSWFGPFDRFREYEEEINRPNPDDKIVEALRDHIAVESARYLNRYDYPYEGKGYHPDMTMPIGPHRSPDVTITILGPEGPEGAPIRLHEVYGVGEFDEREIKTVQTEAQLRERFETELREKDAEVAAMRREMAELKGLVKGVVIATAPKEKVPA